MNGVMIEKKSPRKGTKTIINVNPKTIFTLPIEKKSPRKGTKTTVQATHS